MFSVCLPVSCLVQMGSNVIVVTTSLSMSNMLAVVYIFIICLSAPVNNFSDKKNVTCSETSACLTVLLFY